MIAHHLDGRLGRLRESKMLTWMPAHQTPAAIGRVLKSTGAPITAFDWRGNHLVDGLAKKTAAVGATTAEEAKLVASAEHLVRHCAGQLAAATFWANNVTEHYTDDLGKERTRTRRDSQEIPKASTKKQKLLKPLVALQPTPEVVPPPPAESSEDQSEPEAAMTRRACRRAAKAAADKRSKKIQAEALSGIVQAKRLNHREAVVDTHRRKGLGAKLCEPEAVPNLTGFDSFLNLTDAEVVEEFLGTEPPPTVPANAPSVIASIETCIHENSVSARVSAACDPAVLRTSAEVCVPHVLTDRNHVPVHVP